MKRVSPRSTHSFALLKHLCEIPGPSGEERAVRNFLIDYTLQHQSRWRVQPVLYYDAELQDCLILKFGSPRTALFAHMDTVGFTVRYEDQLITIGSPEAPEGTSLVGRDSRGDIRCTLRYDTHDHARYEFGRAIDRGTSLTYEVQFEEDDTFIQSPYLDNRLGVFNALKVAETLTDGAIVFSCWEEHGGGAAGYLAEFMFRNWGVRQALISDITWVTEGVQAGGGVAISMRDRSIPRRAFVDKIMTMADRHRLRYQLEVEAAGSSDGGELQRTALPLDWCFIGAPQFDPHTPHERVHKEDVRAMQEAYEVLMAEL